MGKYVDKFKSFREECFTTTIPILTPRVAGAGMMVSPKTLAAAIIGKLTGEPEHDANCDCELCKYREVKKQAQNQVFQQRAKFTNFVEKYTYKHNDNDELTEEEAIYYYQWLSENFPSVVFAYEEHESPMLLADKIAMSHKSKIDMTLLDIVLQKKNYIDIPNSNIEDIIKDVEANEGYLDCWIALQTIAEQLKEGEYAGFDAAIALDIP
jgi:hypothetical protein